MMSVRGQLGRKMTMSRKILTAMAVAVLVALASFAAPPTARAVPPDSLSGELFVASPVDVVANCSETGTSTISFSATGQAFGPYAGTFTEVGTVTIGQTPPTPAQFVNGFPLTRVSSLLAFFTIDSPAGQVTGTKRLLVPTDEVLGTCSDFTDRALPGGTPILSGTFRRVTAVPFGLAYEAIITTEEGTFGDEGNSGMVLEEFLITASTPPGGAVEADVFNEAFSSTGIVPLSGEGHATGGGQVDPDVAFGFQAKSNGGFKGGCTVVDQASDIRVKCLDVTTFAQTGNRAVFSGTAEVNGQRTHYRIEVVDEAESGAGVDRFRIETASGYSAGGVLVAGNVQVHQ
jgi:hypothetical protein